MIEDLIYRVKTMPIEELTTLLKDNNIKFETDIMLLNYKFINGEITFEEYLKSYRGKLENIVWGRSYDEYYGRWSEWKKAEFLKEDEDLEYGRYVCLTWTHDGKVVDCFDEIKPYNE